MLFFNMHTRHRKILNILQTGKLEIAKAADALGVTEMTIRRDLKFLEERKLILPVKGGAVLHPARYEPEKSPMMLTPEKFALAEALYNEVMPAERIFLGAGFTVLAFAKVLARRRRVPVTVITNSLSAASALFQTRHKVILTGGELRQTSLDLTGPLTERVIAEYHVEWLISGCDRASALWGFFTVDEVLQQLEKQEMALADKVAIVTESSKFNRTGGVCFAAPEAVSLLVTDNGIAPESATILREKGVKIRQVALSHENCEND